MTKRHAMVNFSLLVISSLIVVGSVVIIMTIATEQQLSHAQYHFI